MYSWHNLRILAVALAFGAVLCSGCAAPSTRKPRQAVRKKTTQKAQVNYNLLAKGAYKRAAYPRAAVYLHKITSKQVGYKTKNLNLGFIALKRANLAQAQSYAQKALKSCISCQSYAKRNVYALLGEIALQLKKPQEALKWLKKATKLQPGDTSSTQLYQELGVKLGDPQYWLARAQNEYAGQNFSAAQQHLHKAKALDDQLLEIWQLAYLVAGAQNNSPQELLALQKITKLAPQNPQNYDKLTDLAYQQQRILLAYQSSQQGSANKTRSFVAKLLAAKDKSSILILAQAAMAQNDLTQAYFFWDKLLYLDPDSAQARVGMGKCLLRKNTHSSAGLKYITDTIKIDPNYGEALLFIADNFYRSQQLKKAEALYRKLQQSNYSGPKIVLPVAKIKTIDETWKQIETLKNELFLFEQQELYEKSIENYRAIIKRYPYDPETYVRLIEHLFRLDRTGDITQALAECDRLEIFSAGIYYMRALLDIRNGQTDQAMYYLRQALSLNPAFKPAQELIANRLKSLDAKPPEAATEIPTEIRNLWHQKRLTRAQVAYMIDFIAEHTSVLRNIAKQVIITDLEGPIKLQAAINRVVSYGYMRLLSGHDFFPEKIVARGDFTVIITRMLEQYQPDKQQLLLTDFTGSNSPFLDINNHNLYYDSVMTASTNGLMYGFRDGYFYVNRPISGPEARDSLLFFLAKPGRLDEAARP